MKLSLKLLGIIILALCCILVGCKKEKATGNEPNNETENTNNNDEDELMDEDNQVSEGENDNQSVDNNLDNDIDINIPEENNDEDENDESEDTKVNENTTWELIAEISPSEKSLSSRLAGFLSENFGITTAMYGIVNYTLDGGETWTEGNNKSSCITGLEFIDEDNIVIACNYSEVRVSEDGGANWKEAAKFGDMLNGHCRYVSFIDKNTGWIANKKEIGYTIDGCQNWSSVKTPEDMSNISEIWLSSTTEGYILSSDGILYRTTDGGELWTEKDLGIGNINVLVCPILALHVDDQHNFQIVIFEKDEEGYCYLSTADGGDTWDKELIGIGGLGYIHLNRDNTILTINEPITKLFKVYKIIE